MHLLQAVTQSCDSLFSLFAPGLQLTCLPRVVHPRRECSANVVHLHQSPMKFGQTSSSVQSKEKVNCRCLASHGVRLTCSALGRVHAVNVRGVFFAARGSWLSGQELRRLVYWLFIAPLALSDFASDHTVSGQLSMTLLALAALLGVQAEDHRMPLAIPQGAGSAHSDMPTWIRDVQLLHLASEALQYWHGTSRRWHLDYKF